MKQDPVMVFKCTQVEQSAEFLTHWACLYMDILPENKTKVALSGEYLCN